MKSAVSGPTDEAPRLPSFDLGPAQRPRLTVSEASYVLNANSTSCPAPVSALPNATSVPSPFSCGRRRTRSACEYGQPWLRRSSRMVPPAQQLPYSISRALPLSGHAVASMLSMPYLDQYWPFRLPTVKNNNSYRDYHRPGLPCQAIGEAGPSPPIGSSPNTPASADPSVQK